MENCNFFLPKSAYPMEDLQNRITETILNLNTDLGGIHRADEALFRMFELAFPSAKESELEEFTKVQGAMRCITALVRSNAKTFDLWVEEQKSYKINDGT